MGSVVTNDFYALFKGKRVIVTGDTGFKGSWLCQWLCELGAEVVGFALPPERAGDHYCLLGLAKGINHVDGDIRDIASLRKVFREFEPEFLFHLAAQSLVRLSYQDPKMTFDTNVGGSVNLLEMIRESDSLRSAIYVTSDKCYRNKEWIWGYRENDELGGRDPYSASKAAAELVLASYLDSYFTGKPALGVASVRAGNVIGGGDWALDRIVPDSIKAITAGNPIAIRSPLAIRPWQHVLEPLSGYLKLAAALYSSPQEYSGSWNFGPNSESVRTVGDLVDKLIECWGDGSAVFERQQNAPHEATLLRLNCDKASQLLKWIPRWDFDETVRETVRWYKETAAGRPAIDLTQAQIRKYMEVSSR